VFYDRHLGDVVVCEKQKYQTGQKCSQNLNRNIGDSEGLREDFLISSEHKGQSDGWVEVGSRDLPGEHNQYPKA
jgi:hypothetical protein